ncbi:glycine zipper 2TM domain-containing protein [Altererythrobacter xixiisoli]|uniref:17 kDa surface antigen n=1 Tax=Croceibacterium xixiisoli TaxID=1476466 RepID=A0A6I4TWQ4_9SPHN|nr:glycine zipper 2TM domain-containing protein [Croceibacterium xixiisoli]MXO99680.1 glycine zipper 2TM domain-containing protein [Croceibacterium xixiisoli]
MTNFFKHAAIAFTAGTMAVLATPAAAADIQGSVSNQAVSQLFSQFQSSSAITADDSEWNRDRRRHHRDRHYGRDDRRWDRDERLTRNHRVWRGRDGRAYCQRSNGTTGLIIGGAAGALLGREIDGGRDRTLGTVLGAAGGALLGREIDRGGSSCR